MQYGKQSQGLFYVPVVASPGSVVAQHMLECPEKSNQYLDYIQYGRHTATLQHAKDR